MVVWEIVFVCILGWVGLYTPGSVGWVAFLMAKAAFEVLGIGYYDAPDVSIRHISFLFLFVFQFLGLFT